MSGLTDVHVHLAALPTASNGCRISRRMLASPAARMTARRLGLPLDDAEAANRIYLERLGGELSASARVARAVLLGMDGAYDAAGAIDEARTDFLVSNDAVFAACAQDGRLLPGVSINPARRDALEELERCAARGAALVKQLPNAQAFDPAEPRFRPFYRAMARLGLPLLSHVGFEFTLIGHDQSKGDPARLVPALEEGVTVIAAHGCSRGLFLFEPHFDTMLDLARRFAGFYVDTSALTLPNRVGALLRLRRRPELFDRLLFGTDFPLPCPAYPCLLVLAFGAWRRARAAASRFDRQVLTLEGLGLRLGADFSKLPRPSLPSGQPPRH